MIEDKVVSKTDLLNKLRAYRRTPDDDNIVYKQKIEKALLSNPYLLYALNEKDLESELFNDKGNINWEWDEKNKKYEPLGEWDRYFGSNSNIRPFLFIPDTQTKVHGDDRMDKLTGLPRHDLIASIIREQFNWSNIFGLQTKLISSKESMTDNNYVVRTLVFQIYYDINGITYSPFGEQSYIRNNESWQ